MPKIERLKQKRAQPNARIQKLQAQQKLKEREKTPDVKS